MNYAFTLEVSGIDTGREDYDDALYEAGCDDALIAVVNGKMFLDFPQRRLVVPGCRQICIPRRRACGGQGRESRAGYRIARLADLAAPD
jgi:hypothetical protein